MSVKSVKHSIVMHVGVVVVLIVAQKAEKKWVNVGEERRIEY